MTTLVDAYRDALALTRAAIAGEHSMAAEMVATLNRQELCQILSATAALAAVLAEETSRNIGIPSAQLMHDLRPKDTA